MSEPTMRGFQIRAKFYVSSLELLPGKDAGVRVHLMAVARGDRNAQWATATPVGDMHMTVNNPTAAKRWEDFMQAARATGKQPELFIDLAPSEDGWPGDGHLFRPSEGHEGTIYASTYCGECGLTKDQELTEYDSDLHKAVAKGLAHPHG
jgi:hypothetical protein